MKDLDKGKCVRPARSAHRGTDRLNGIAALSEKSAELPDAEVRLNWRVCVCVCDGCCTRATQAGAENTGLRNQRLAGDSSGFFECSKFISTSVKSNIFTFLALQVGRGEKKQIKLLLIASYFCTFCSLTLIKNKE